MDPKSSRIYWEHKFPLGEGVNTPFASFREEIKKGEPRSYIVVLTEVGKLYLFDCLDGSIIWSRVIANNPIKRKGLIKILELSNRILISILFEDYLIVLDSKRGEEILRIKLSFSASSLIFFSLKDEPRLICSGEEGIVQCFSVDGSILWSKMLNGKINYEGTLAIFDGIPYLLFATSSKALYVLDGLRGEVLDIFTLPGLPRSSVSFDSETLFWFLLTSQGLFDSGKSFLYGRSLIKNSIQKETKVEIEGESFIGPVGMRIKDETVLYFVNEEGLLYAVQKGARKPISNYPIRLVSDNEIQATDSLKGYISLTEGALFITANNFGFTIIGFPFTLSERPYLSSFSYLGSEDLSAKTVNFSGARFRNDLDSLPSIKVNLKKPLNISPYDNSGHIITPIVYFDKLAGELRIISVSANGELIVMEENGEEIESINPGIGPIYTEPVITFDEKGNRITYLMGLNGIVSLCKSINITEKWRRADLGSCGSSAALLKTNLEERLIFVDKLNYLTSLNILNGETIFREKVDCRDFALNEVDGEKFIFCGSKMINAKNGLVVKNSFIKGSSSTAEGIGGRLLLFQSDDLDMLCIDPKNDGLVWRVRKLWCKKYCFDGQSPAILRKGSWALSFWCDYTRIVCVEVNSGLIRWSFSANDDFFVSKPTVAETLDGAYVFTGSINGKIYAFDCFTGRLLPDYPIQLPGKAINLEVLKGASSPVVVNGLLLVNRVEYGLIGIGKSRETNRLSAMIGFKVEVKENRRGKIIFNQAILYWDNKYKRSNTVKN
jgi:outer membrane protein assembly factor BamB